MFTTLAESPDNSPHSLGNICRCVKHAQPCCAPSYRPSLTLIGPRGVDSGGTRGGLNVPEGAQVYPVSVRLHHGLLASLDCNMTAVPTRKGDAGSCWHDTERGTRPLHEGNMETPPGTCSSDTLGGASITKHQKAFSLADLAPTLNNSPNLTSHFSHRLTPRWLPSSQFNEQQFEVGCNAALHCAAMHFS